MTPEEIPGLIVRPLEGPGELAEALALNARVYANRGIVDSVEDERLNDRWIGDSVYFGAFVDDELTGVARLIPYVDDMHLYALFDIDPEWKARLDAVPLHDNVFEVSALSVPKSAPGGFFAVSAALYRGMFQYSLAEQRYIWFAGLTPMLGRILNKMMGIPLQIIGPRADVLGAVRMPAVIDLLVFMDHAHRNAPEEFAYFTDGLEIDLTDTPSHYIDTTAEISFGPRS